MKNNLAERLEICKSVGIENLAKAHEIVAEGVRKGVNFLMQKGLYSRILIGLGYDE